MVAFGVANRRVLRIKLGSGVVSMWVRNPAFLAATFSTLDDLAPGRVILGIGAWWDPLAAKVGVDRSRPLRAMREIVTAVRALLANETVTFRGNEISFATPFIQPRRPSRSSFRKKPSSFRGRARSRIPLA